MAAIVQAKGDGIAVWGGDFNQTLFGTEMVGSLFGQKDLVAAFDNLDLRVLTQDSPGLAPPSYSIDHIAVPAHLGFFAPRCVQPTVCDRPLSDHPAYLAEIALSGGGDA